MSKQLKIHLNSIKVKEVGVSGVQSMNISMNGNTEGQQEGANHWLHLETVSPG